MNERFDFLTPIATPAAARQFIVNMSRAGVLFHFDDNPADVITADGRPLFAPDDVPAVRARVAELFALLADPFELAVALTSYPEFFDMDAAELSDRIDVLYQTMPADDHARNWDGHAELEALELALKIKNGEGDA